MAAPKNIKKAIEATQRHLAECRAEYDAICAQIDAERTEIDRLQRGVRRDAAEIAKLDALIAAASERAA